MENYIPISFLNDFIFCPRSIYFHQLYADKSTKLYHTTDQTDGLMSHLSIDAQTYSTSKHILQGIYIYSATYMLCGKIDTYDGAKKLLVERKKRIKVIYDGYIFQLYAQYHAMTEMGYEITKMHLYSMDDNKSFPIELPEDNPDMQLKFEKTIAELRSFDLNAPFSPNVEKCRRCIYQHLCDKALC